MANDSLLDVNDILTGYCDDVQEYIEEAAKKIALSGKNKLKSNSPKKTGKYSRGWTLKTIKGRGYARFIIYNKTNWQLTHLLEKPHATRNGLRTNPIVHIKPVEEECISEFEKNVKRIIESS